MSKPKKEQKQKLQSINERLYLEVSRELDLPLKLVKDVILNGQSKFTAITMASNTFDGIRWPYFGVFKAKHKEVQILNHMKGLDDIQKTFFRDMLRLRRWRNKQKFKNK